MQKLLTLIITAGILYMIYQQGINKIEPPEQLRKNPAPQHNNNNNDNSEPQTGTFLEKTLSGVLINVLKSDEGRLFMESMLQPMNKTMAGSGAGFKINNDDFINSLFQIHTFGEGIEGPASCGHIVTVQYKILNNQYAVLEDKIVTFPLGTEKIAKGVDAVIVGMKTGETRNATISNKYLQNNEDTRPATLKISILLKEIIPKNFIDDCVKIFDDQIAYRIPLMCGNKVVYDAKITRLNDGNVLYSSEKLNKKIDMKIGNLSYPMIFSYALHNKIPVGTRTVITKGKYLKSFASNYSTIFPNKTLPDNEYFMIELYNFDDSIITNPAVFPHKNNTNHIENQAH